MPSNPRMSGSALADDDTPSWQQDHATYSGDDRCNACDCDEKAQAVRSRHLLAARHPRQHAARLLRTIAAELHARALQPSRAHPLHEPRRDSSRYAGRNRLSRRPAQVDEYSGSQFGRKAEMSRAEVEREPVPVGLARVHHRF